MCGELQCVRKQTEQLPLLPWNTRMVDYRYKLIMIGRLVLFGSNNMLWPIPGPRELTPLLYRSITFRIRMGPFMIELLFTIHQYAGADDAGLVAGHASD